MATTITANGINFPDGSAGSPSIGGTDTNTGLFTGSDIVGFATGGSERLRIDASGNVNIANDSGKLQLGASNDLQIYHDGSNSYIKDSGTGLLIIESNQLQIKNDAADEKMIVADANGAVELYYDNSKKFHTYSDGCSVFGHLNLEDNDKLRFGDSSDLQIYHDGTDSIISHQGGTAGDLILQTTGSDDDVFIKCNDDFIVNVQGGAENAIIARNSGEVELFHNNTLRYFTRSNGGTVQGATANVSLDLRTDTTHRGSIYANSSNQIGFLDTGGDWAIKHTNDTSTEFYVQTNKKATIDADGLKFGTDTAAANALDDYEYGTFDPTFRENNNASNTSYAWRYGEYTKIGRIVHCRIAMGLSAFSGNFSNAFLGLPYTAYSQHGNSNFDYVPVLGYSYASGFGDSDSQENLFMEIYGHNVSSFRIVKGNSKTNVSQNDISSGQRIAINFTYTAAA